MRVVIIGNGIAGIEAALTVRTREPRWEITIVSEESDNLFSRTALMWVFSGQMSHRDIEPYERDLYERMGFRRVRARAIGVDVEARVVELAGDLPALPFDRLLLACGSRPRPGPWPGSDLEGVGHFVTLQDLEWLEQEVLGGPGAGRPPRPDAHHQASERGSPYHPRPVLAQRRGRPPRAPAVIGGGLIGIEAVEILVAAGLRPRFFIREEWFWPMAIAARESRWITERMRDHGVEVLLEHEVDRLVGDAEGALKAIETDQGSFAADLAVIAIGVVPNTDWLEGSGIPIHDKGGVPVEADLATEVEGVFAAGDCALVPAFDGSKKPEQLWYTARDQGRVAGCALLGDPVRYDRGVLYNSAKLMDIEYTTVGMVNMNVEGERSFFFEETGKVRSTTRIVETGGKVIGFNLLGRRWDHSVLMRFIEERRSLGYVLDHLNEAAFDTEFVPPLRIPDAEKRKALEGSGTHATSGESIRSPHS